MTWKAVGIETGTIYAIGTHQQCVRAVNERISNTGQVDGIGRAVTYRADFEVYYTDGRVEVVDIKGFPTPEFKIKAKMFMFRYQVPLVLLKWSTASKKFVEA